MTPDNIVTLNVTKKSWKEKYLDALHQFLANYLRRLSEKGNPCAVCGGHQWFPHSKNFPTCLPQFGGMPYCTFLMVSCSGCMNTLFFYIDSKFMSESIAFKKDFIKKHGTEEEALTNGL